jgi:hypothetical protein
MRHDYNLPREWPDMTDAEKCRWYTQERARRQVIRQKEAGAMVSLDFLEREVFDRLQRRQEARAGTVDMAEYR